MNRQFLSAGGTNTHVPKNFEGGRTDVDEDYLNPLPRNLLPEWGDAFQQSKRFVLDNKARMEKIRADRIAYLDQTLKILSAPVNTDATPPPTEA